MKWLLLFISWTCFAQLPTVPDATQSATGIYPSVTAPDFRWVSSDVANGTVTSWVDRIHSLNLGRSGNVGAYKNPTGVFLNYSELITNSAIAQPVTSSFYVIAQQNRIGGASFYGPLWVDTSAHGMIMTNGSKFSYWLGSGGGSGGGANVAYYATVVADDAGHIWTNGVQQCTDAASGNYSPVHLGTTGGQYPACYIAEMAFWTNHVITSTEASALNTYATTAWPSNLIQGTLPYYTNICSVNPDVWYSADWSGIQNANNTAFDRWESMGVNGWQLVPSASGALYLSSGGANNRAWCYFENGVTQFAQSVGSITYAQPNWIFAVTENTNTSALGVVVDGNTAREQIALQNGGANGSYIYAGTILKAGNVPDNKWHLWSAFFNGGSSIVRTDMVQAATGNAGTQGLDTMNVGGQTGGGNRLQGGLAELLVFHSNLSSQDIFLVETYLTNKYKLPGG